MINVKNVSVVYPDGTRAVGGVSFSLPEGGNTALIGGNGAGKTTLLLALVGVVALSGGSVEVDGIFLEKQTLNEIRRRVGMVFQNPDDQLFMPSIYDDVAFGPLNLGVGAAEADERVDSALRMLGAQHLKTRSPLKLSGGEKRSAAIATVLAMEPSAMLFDEPTAFLDPRARRNLAETLTRLPHTKLIATHDLHFAREVCTRAVILKDGGIFADGDPRVLLRDEALMRECGM